MDSFLQYYLTTIIYAALLPLVVAFMFIHFKRNTTKKNPPPKVPGALPVIGHLSKLRSKNPPHQVLGDMADKYGPAFTIQFGSHQTLVISNWEMVRECFTSTNDKCFSNRPSPLVNQHIFYSADAFAFGPYGPFWREIRKLCALHLLSNHRLELLKPSRKSEMDLCFKKLYKLWSTTSDIYQGNDHKKPAVLVEMKKWFEDIMFNVVARVVVGKQNLGTRDKGVGSADYEAEGEKYKQVMDEARKYMTTVVVTDIIPYLWWIDYLRGMVSSMKRTAKKLDAILMTWLEEHRLCYHGRKVHKNHENIIQEDENHDFMDVMLSVTAEEGDIQVFDHDPDGVIKATCLDMILGGSDTTTVVLTWTLSLLLNNRDVLKKARDELDLHVGKQRQVEESDIKNLIYLQAIFKEAMRLYPAATLNERSTSEDCIVGGYDIPAGTHLFINTWKIQRDPRVWGPDPLEFRPERFLSKEHSSIDVKGQHFELIPFGAGRRSCPGISFALQLIHSALARLIHGFELATPSDSDVDMSELSGHFNYKATPLQVLVTPRFHSEFYGC